MTRRRGLYAVLTLVVAASAAVSSLAHPHNPGALAGAPSQAESTALYCSGLSSATGPSNGHVLFTNTTGSSRSIALRVSSDAPATWTGTLELAPHASSALAPSTLVKGDHFGVAAEVGGDGVVGEVVTRSLQAQSPCATRGVHSWWATGFDTSVGSTATLNILNTTATPAVYSISLFTAAGYSQPALFQGLTVAPHGATSLDLGNQVVNTANVGVHVKVLRGSLAIVGVESSHGVVSLVRGVHDPSRHAWFPSVTTVNLAHAEIRVANPHSTTVSVRLNVHLTHFQVAPLTLQVAPYSTSDLVVTPNSAVAPDGYAAVTLRASAPVVADLAVGNGTFWQLSASPVPVRSLVIDDVTAQGFDALRVTNTASRRARVTVVVDSSAGSSTRRTTIGAGATLSVRSLVNRSSWKNVRVLVSARHPSLVAGVTLVTRPAGVIVVDPLDGR